MKSILCTLCLAFAACSTAPQITEVGSAVGGAYTNPKTGESYAGQASSYVKFNGHQSGGKEVVLPKFQK